MALKKEQQEYIKQNCLIKTDEDIANELKIQIATVMRWRRKFGIHKGQGGAVTNIEKTASQKVVLSEHERQEFFRVELMNSFYYNTLKTQFSKDELDYYLEEWGSLCTQFQDIVQTEKRQIDELIKTGIMDNRILKYIKVVEEEIDKLIEEVENIRENKPSDEDSDEDSGDDDADKRDATIMEMVASMNASAKAMVRDHLQLVQTKNTLYEQLNARRKDRLDQIRKTGTTFLSLLEAFQNEKVRQIQGEHMEMVRLAKENKAEQWRKQHRFLDGEMNPILLDDKTDFDSIEKQLKLRKNKTIENEDIDEKERNERTIPDIPHKAAIDTTSGDVATESVTGGTDNSVIN